ncbi:MULTISPECIES: LLM class flavin-dependent oxidoreductase [Spongiibacter]|uniref:LLM class flavin-dependent oxidoreductase n=1 Tax=Spongiibacter TaxID=630749 RepID=UPI000C64435D|nr:MULTISPECIES: LLM class flavin-dependent oxidoreductase [Spongiibacter]MAY39211.1 LLM class flavin-dependent oxidoreductase [Spongiibacter sp.]|tara:strand:- start:334 stop:1212 length:879 start_codon:yes stop_codon:yes gene_type:complete
MKIGVCLPYMKRGLNRQTFQDWCRIIDQGPFSSLSCGERVTGYSMEMRNILAFAAASTERVRIIPSLYVLPMHSAVQAAKEIATLDILSNGRVTVTVGVGGREKDYQALGAEMKGRFQRMDEQIALMKRIWRGEQIDDFDEIGPDPVQAGGPPILVGAMGPKSIQRVSKWADGLYGFAMDGDAGLINHFFSSADRAWAESGRKEKPYRMGGFWYSLADNSQQALRDYVFDYLKVFGDDEAEKVARTMRMHDPQAILDGIAAIEELGCDELQLVPASSDIAEVDRLANLLAGR